MDDFLTDVWRGLNAEPKYLQSKYFYDEKGDALFKEIMACPEYYLTRCELEIFSDQSNEISRFIMNDLQSFDLVELGPGDATKSVYLLDALMTNKADFTYYPIDISEHVIAGLEASLPLRFPGIRISGLNGEYLKMLGEMKATGRQKVLLFLGYNIGNIPLPDTIDFLNELRFHLATGDMALIGFDLKKDPAIILAAYNDSSGITRRFNLNLLQRINDRLGADFDLARFEHQPEYDETTGSCRSYLVSRVNQSVNIMGKGTIQFEKGDRIFMEVSQKYTVPQTDGFAAKAGLTPVHHFFDKKKWFLDALWRY